MRWGQVALAGGYSELREDQAVIRKVALFGAAGLLVAGAAQGTEVKRSVFGTLPDGRSVPAVTLINSKGVSATIIAYGATLQSLVMPDQNGHRADVALGYDNLQQYLAKPQYFGGTVGR